MDETEAAVVRELIDAAEGLMDAMYNSDLQDRQAVERWHAACTAAQSLPGVRPVL